MKIIAMYLPQFHETEENNRWWGKGFTDWVSAKNAVPLFEGHKQPKKPYDDNYYDLLNKNTMQWQATLAKAYNIYGFCFYHYWFGNGKLVLEKPAENLLRWTDIEMNFCFSWDSTPWARTWSRVSGAGAWASPSENATKMNNMESVLLEQKYGRESQWETHFYYLLPFFKDKRYIKIEGKPVFIFYSSHLVYCLDDMVAYWNELAVKEGVEGVYTIVTNADEENWENVDASLIQEPGIHTASMIQEEKYQNINSSQVLEYNAIWEKILSAKHNINKRRYYGGIVDFDNSPRKAPALLYSGGTPKSYSEKLSELLLKNYLSGNEITFINAWNEWGEGMYLEPDEDNEHAYLEATRQAYIEFEKKKKEQTALVHDNEFEVHINVQTPKMYEYYNLMNQWLYLVEDEKLIGEYFITNGFKEVAIYGYGDIAKHLLFQLDKSNVIVKYIIEQNKRQNSVPYKLVTLTDEFETVDVIIITPFIEYKNIKKTLRERINCPIISIKEVIMEM